MSKSWICLECSWEGHLPELAWDEIEYACPKCHGKVQYVGQTDHE